MSLLLLFLCGLVCAHTASGSTSGENPLQHLQEEMEKIKVMHESKLEKHEMEMLEMRNKLESLERQLNSVSGIS